MVYSHHDPDHIAGGKPFKDAGATFVAVNSYYAPNVVDGTFENAGTLIETRGAAYWTTVLNNDVTGTVHVENGGDFVLLNGGTIAGTAGTTTFLGDAGTFINFAGNFTFTAASSIQGATVEYFQNDATFLGSALVEGAYQASDSTAHARDQVHDLFAPGLTV